MKNGRIAPPGYVLPNRPSWQGGWNIRSVVGAAIAFVLAASAATEWLAIQLNNPVEMGYPILWVRGTAVFQPFAALVLWKHYAGSRLMSSGVRKDLWIAFGATIVGGLFLACFTYWFLSLNYSGQRTDFYLKHIFRSVEQVLLAYRSGHGVCGWITGAINPPSVGSTHVRPMPTHLSFRLPFEASGGSLRGRITGNPHLTACWSRPESPCRRGPLGLAIETGFELNGKIGLHIRDQWTAHLKWLDENISTVRAIRVAEAEWTLGGRFKISPDNADAVGYGPRFIQIDIA